MVWRGVSTGEGIRGYDDPSNESGERPLKEPISKEPYTNNNHEKVVESAGNTNTYKEKAPVKTQATTQETPREEVPENNTKQVIPFEPSKVGNEVAPDKLQKAIEIGVFSQNLEKEPKE